MDLLPTATAVEEAERGAGVAVLPVGSFEQHGEHLPLATDAIIAHIIAQQLATSFNLLALPPITVACSHEHEGLNAGTVSISAKTLHSIVTDTADSLARMGIRKLAIVSAHGGNYVLSNVVQEANVTERRMLLYPSREAVAAARAAAGCVTNTHDDMHAGEWETSILLHAAPSLVREGWRQHDNAAPNRPDLLTVGMRGYAPNGVIGQPSAATAAKGAAILDVLTKLFAERLTVLTG